MIKVDLLKNHPNTIPVLAKIWYEVLGKIWFPELTVQEIETLTYQELDCEDEITSFVALYEEIPVGFCTFKLKEEFRSDLGPWLSDLVVGTNYQKKGIGKKLVEVAVLQAKKMGFKKLYLFTFDLKVTQYYQLLGWNEIGIGEFKSRSGVMMELYL